ncbi:DUF2141 domain-containing protein [Phenylobacterium sp.]|uniref:DUF2141 domain-containing protein n=1 Tax=Phenylobacterium sp. TaxID=1871053 RepID=UPI0025DE30CA|nr:DUF2141 domain-containing protein [Phenylobacterium sp.]
MPALSQARRAALAHILSIALAGAALIAAPDARAADTATLNVVFKGIRTPTGAVMMTLAGSEAAYGDKAPAAGQAVLKVEGAEVTATFNGLPPGRYAVKAFHDVNGDGKMGQNPFGIPTEPFAFSNGARAVMGPPTWDAASFEVTAGANTQTIEID